MFQERLNSSLVVTLSVIAIRYDRSLDLLSMLLEHLLLETYTITYMSLWFMKYKRRVDIEMGDLTISCENYCFFVDITPVLL
jgi:hypothetical protein